jgi:hypothetical protein
MEKQPKHSRYRVPPLSEEDFEEAKKTKYVKLVRDTERPEGGRATDPWQADMKEDHLDEAKRFRTAYGWAGGGRLGKVSKKPSAAETERQYRDRLNNIRRDEHGKMTHIHGKPVKNKEKNEEVLDEMSRGRWRKAMEGKYKGKGWKKRAKAIYKLEKKGKENPTPQYQQEEKSLWDFLSESPEDNYFLKNRPAPGAERRFLASWPGTPLTYIHRAIPQVPWARPTGPRRSMIGPRDDKATIPAKTNEFIRPGNRRLIRK